jgi:hypothetical protein
MMEEEPVRFVIIASHRTGSTMLVSALNSHARVQCYGEFFRKKNKPFKGVLKKVAMQDERYEDKEYQMSHWQDFLETVYQVSDPVDAIGFKLMLSQHEEARHTLIADSQYRKILLKRENVLAVYSSNKIAKETGQGSAGQGDEVKTAQVMFIPEEFDKYCAKYEHMYQLAEDELHDRGQLFLKVTYADICKPEGIENVLGFIGVDKSLPWEPRTKKRNSPLLAERFSNPEEVIAYMENLGKSHWLQE